MPQTHFDALKLLQALYSYWAIGFAIVTGIGVLFRSRIARGVRKFLLAFYNASALRRLNDALTARAREAEESSEDWRKRFADLDGRYEALKVELDRLGGDLQEIRKRMTSAEEHVKMLRADRDDLVTHTRLLAGQLHQHGLSPDYPAPALRSIIAMPGPARPEDSARL